MNLFQKQQNTSGYNSIPNAIATDDATAAAVPFGTTIRSTMMMTLGQRSKRMVAIAAGMLLVTGGAAVWLQEDGSYFRSSSGSLATEDGSITTDVEGLAVGYDPDPNDQSSPNDVSGCTDLHGDPFQSGQKVDCCEGLEQEVKDWKQNGKWYWQCENSTPCSDVVCETKQVGGDEKYACGNTRDTFVCYPQKGRPSDTLPVVFYNRDSSGYDKQPSGNKRWLTKMAAQCLITIAPMTKQEYWKSESKDLCEKDHDSVLAFDFLYNNQNWSKKWGITAVTPDWSRIAAAGQSSGAHHIPRLQMLMYDKGIKMKAVLYGHGGSLDNGKHKDLIECLTEGTACDNVPAMFLTSTDDYPTVPHAWTYNWYEKLIGQKTGSPRVQNAVYAKVPAGHGGHMEPVAGDGVFNDYTARFLACHLYEGSAGSKQSILSQVACAWIYGDGVDNGKKKYL